MAVSTIERGVGVAAGWPREQRTGRPGCMPSDLATLQLAQPGQAVVVRAVLLGAGGTAGLLRAGEVVMCRRRTADWVVIELGNRGEVAVHRHDAQYVHVDRCSGQAVG